MNNLAPIILFVYNRLDHTIETIESLKKNELADKSDLFIFSDAAKNENQQENVKKIRDYLREISGFKTINITEREQNFGLAKSIISGVTELVNKYLKVIVLEDDLFVSPYFLKYMNEALELYENEDSVISIHGYIYPVKSRLPDTFFIKGADCWGWATWKRGWDLFESDGKKLMTELERRRLKKKFDMNGSYKFSELLKGQISGKNDSWAVRWYASAFLNDKYTLYPGHSLVHNTGHDKTGTHSEKTDVYNTNVLNSPVELKKIMVEENEFALREIESFFRHLGPGLIRGNIYKIKKFIGDNFYR